MSLRPSIFAAPVTALREAVAADPGALVQAARQWLEERVGEEIISTVDRDLEDLSRGLWAGQPETERHVYVVDAAAHACGLDAEAAMVHWGDWKIGAYDEYFDIVQPLLPGASAALCEHIQTGRPLFGTVIESDWSYYSFLTATEVRELAADLTSVHQQRADLDAPDAIHGFPTEFRDWLREVAERGTDLWLFAGDIKGETFR